MEKSVTYKDAGVDIDKANKIVEKIKDIANQTPRHGVMGDIGGFGGLFALNVDSMEKPVLVSSTDGVGTKLKIAFMTGKHDTIGIDLVAMCVNDIVVQGARPLFFLDYLSIGRLNEKVVTEIIRGIGEGCRMAGCALIGGETAEMPGLYNESEYDLAGFSVGLVDDNDIVDGSEIRVGDVLVGISSSGLHSNGYSLVRKIVFDILKLKPETHVPELGKSIGEELLTPTKIYVDPLLKLMRNFSIHGLAHITGGGIEENIIRIIPDACNVFLRQKSWEIPPVFTFLKQAGNIPRHEMIRTFNNGIGMVAVVSEKSASDVVDQLNAMNEEAFVIGEITERKSSGTRVKWE